MINCGDNPNELHSDVKSQQHNCFCLFLIAAGPALGRMQHIEHRDSTSAPPEECKVHVLE